MPSIICVRLLTIIASVLSEITVTTADATIRIRINDVGMHFFSQIGHQIARTKSGSGEKFQVNDEIWKIDLPSVRLPVEIGPGYGEINVTNLRIIQFDSPKFNFSFASPSGIVWESTNGSMKLDGKWSAVYEIVVPLQLSGNLAISANDLRLSMHTEFFASKDHPQVKLVDCSITIGDLRVDLSGGLIQWIANLFKVPLSNFVKNLIHRKLCDTIRISLIHDLNDLLASIPKQVKTINNLYINYAFKTDPVATEDHIVAEAMVDVTYRKDQCTLDTPVMDYGVDRTGRMAHIWLSDHIPNCLLQSAHKYQLLQFAITPESDGRYLKEFLQTSCKLPVCIGSFFPILHRKYPNRSVDIFIHTARTPLSHCTNNNNVIINAIAFVDFYLSAYKQQTQRLARLDLIMTATVVPKVFGRKIIGEIDALSVHLSEHDSRIGHFTERLLTIIAAILTDTLRLIVGTALKIGIGLPMVDNITLTNDTQVVTKNGFMRIDFDFIYV